MFLLGEHTRSVAATLYPRRLSIFDRLNSNVDFQAFIADAEPEALRFSERLALYSWLNKYINDEPIDYLEFGVAAGDSIRAWCNFNSNSESRFFGFDTFEGLPEDWTKDKPSGTFGCGGTSPKIADERVSFIKGLFQFTLYDFLSRFTPQRRLVVHIDCDIYSGALFCLAVLDRIMAPGCLLIFDEFYDLQNEFAAFQDYSCSFYRDSKLLGYTNRIEQAAFVLGEKRLRSKLVTG